jgi:hypothetical protein
MCGATMDELIGLNFLFPNFWQSCHELTETDCNISPGTVLFYHIVFPLSGLSRIFDTLTLCLSAQDAASDVLLKKLYTRSNLATGQ